MGWGWANAVASWRRCAGGGVLSMLLSYGCNSRKINRKIPHRSKTLTPVSCALLKSSS